MCGAHHLTGMHRGRKAAAPPRGTSHAAKDAKGEQEATAWNVAPGCPPEGQGPQSEEADSILAAADAVPSGMSRKEMFGRWDFQRRNVPRHGEGWPDPLVSVGTRPVA
jgi:hypothetical protein